jgi:spore maturation protein CgeB
MPSVAIKTAVPNHQVEKSWGDTHFAAGLADALSHEGWPSVVDIRPDWDTSQSDVVVVLRGLERYTPKAGQINVMWLLSHPEDVTIDECAGYDLVLVASTQHAEWLATRISTPVLFVPQATDRSRFHPVAPDPELQTDVLFVGNSRGQQRQAVTWALQLGLPLTIYGKGWTRPDQAVAVRADYYPNEDLARLYASARVVLNDHWPDMAERGFVSNRVFDALGCGAVVVSDRAHGIEDLFGDLVPIYTSRSELRDHVYALFADSDRRADISIKGAELIASQHTFAHRASQIIDALSAV